MLTTYANAYAYSWHTFLYRDIHLTSTHTATLSVKLGYRQPMTQYTYHGLSDTSFGP
jgi:hypothetical protein